MRRRYLALLALLALTPSLAILPSAPAYAASGDTLIVWSAAAANLPATANAEWGTVNTNIVLNFDSGATEERAFLIGVMPRNYGGGGITVGTIWACAVNSGTAGWEVAFERWQDATDTIGSDSFSAYTTITAETVPGTANVVAYSSANVANGSAMDSIAVGEAFRVDLRRDTSVDTAAGDLRLLAVEIKEQ